MHEFEFWPDGTTMEITAFECLKNECLHFFLVAIGLILFETCKLQSWPRLNFDQIRTLTA